MESSRLKIRKFLRAANMKTNLLVHFKKKCNLLLFYRRISCDVFVLVFMHDGLIFCTQKLGAINRKCHHWKKSVSLKQIVKLLKKNNRFFCYFISLSKRYFLYYNCISSTFFLSILKKASFLPTALHVFATKIY